MEKYSELLYWRQFKQCFHSAEDEMGYYYYYDPEPPIRARKSFENWLRESCQRREFRKYMRYIYPNGDPPVIDYEEALEIAREIKPNINYCKEFEMAYIFSTHGENIRFGSVTILKDTGNIVNVMEYEQKGLKKGNHIAIYEISDKA